MSTRLVQEIMREVLFRSEEVPDGKPPKDAVIVNGIRRTFGFHPQRLEARRADVERLIAERVTDPFLLSRGGGMSFLQLAEDRNGEIWAEHPTLEELCCLAIGLGLAGWCLPKEDWKILPGNMPYVWFKTP